MTTPNRVRTKIRKYLSNYILSTDEMASKIGVPTDVYTNFMTGENQKYTHTHVPIAWFALCYPNLINMFYVH